MYNIIISVAQNNNTITPTTYKMHRTESSRVNLNE